MINNKNIFYISSMFYILEIYKKNIDYIEHYKIPRNYFCYRIFLDVYLRMFIKYDYIYIKIIINLEYIQIYLK